MDHGVLNVPLAKRGNIDAQIDRHKADLVKQRRADAKTKRTNLAADRCVAHALLDNASAECVQHLATKCNVSVSAMRKRLRSDCHWQPSFVIRLLRAQST